MPMNEIVSVDGVNLNVITRGEGAPVVLLGGPWFGHRYLRTLADSLAADFRVIAYDPRGSGHSSALTREAINLSGHLADLEGLRRVLELQRLNLIGHSLGALVCLAYAVGRPQNTGALILANPGPPLVKEMQEMLHIAFMGALTEVDREILEEIRASSGFQARDAETHEAYFKTMYAAFLRDREVASHLEFGFTPTTAQYALEAEEQLVGQLLAMNLVDQLATVASPTLVIHSEQDLIPAAFSHLLVDQIPGSELAFLDGVGHFAYLEDIDLFRRTAVNFLRFKA